MSRIKFGFYLLIIGFFLILWNGCVTTTISHEHTHNLYSLYGELMPSAIPDQIIANLTEDPLTSVAVNWRTDTTVHQGEVRIAVATHGPTFREDFRTIKAKTSFFQHQFAPEPEIISNYHSAIIDDLNPGMQYVYQVGFDTIWSEWFQIRTPSPDHLSLIYFGDAQNDVKSMWSRVIRQAYSTFPRIDFMLHAGDLINRHDRDLEWAEWFHAGSFIHAMVPSMMTPGNHEYSKTQELSPQWKPQFNLPGNGPKGLEETCYVVDYPLVKVISLDAEQIDESPTYRELQKVWLDSVLAENTAPWVILTLHYPFFSTKPLRDNAELRADFKPILDKYKVDLVLQGHDHAYGRGEVSNTTGGTNLYDKNSGTVYVVSVSGPKMYPISEDPWMDRRATNTQLFQFISMD
ncbi:MAG: metallophosphoesterase family protein, partial [Saprospiraceae bacterium]|nr:metallophosphoesterase family protein [Saprospiraceae bacterium]